MKITVAKCPQLNGKYTIFGEVIEGMETVDRIVRAEYNQCIIKSIVIEE